ncbi:hypothetical protein CWI39_0006p0010 [Hamiltosporidium magnivora]|uniref:Uncharacterized protein n=1 Tax=Hamiltosporidium magnivora TaxID=148818 RepID=A0A4Q9LR59_9MICR|nr:hypothetical protein CWI39_0006p0010 [Hamiltosporidium magnivora]
MTHALKSTRFIFDKSNVTVFSPCHSRFLVLTFYILAFPYCLKIIVIHNKKILCSISNFCEIYNKKSYF